VHVNVVHGAGSGDRGGASAKIVCHFVNPGGGAASGQAPVARPAGRGARVELVATLRGGSLGGSLGGESDDEDGDGGGSGLHGDVRGSGGAAAMLPAYVDFDVLISGEQEPAGGGGGASARAKSSALAEALVAQVAPLAAGVASGANVVLVSSPMCHWAGEEALGGYLHRLLPPRAFDGRVTATVQCRELTDGGNTVVDLVRDQAAAWGGASSADGAVALTQRECASRDDVKQWLRFATKRASKRAVARLFEVVVANAESGVRGRLALVQLAPLRDDSNSMQALDAAMSSTIRAINAARDGRALAARPGAAGKGGAPARPNGALAALLSDVIAGAARTVWVLHLDPYAPRGRVGKALQRVEALRTATGGNSIEAMQQYGGAESGAGTVAMRQMRQQIDALKRSAGGGK
jgi:hypothetical protein